MQKKFTANRQFHPNPPRFVGQAAVTQPRFLGQPIADLQRPLALLPDPIEVAERNQTQPFINRNRKLSNLTSFPTQPVATAFRHKINLPSHDNRVNHKNPPFGTTRNKMSTVGQDIRINHKFDISRKPMQHNRLKKTENFNKDSLVMPPSVILSITNYPPSCNEATLIMFFAKIKGFIQLFNHRTKKHVSFAIYTNIDQATEALTAYNGLHLDHDHALHVGFSTHKIAYCE